MDRSDSDGMPWPDAALGRRQFLRGAAGAGLAAGAGGLLVACSSGSPSSPSPSASPAASGARKRGGSLKVGLTGGSSSDTIDPHEGLTYTDTAREQSLYNALVQLDGNAQVEYVLAESITPHNGSPSEWIIKLRSGITFHDGKPLTAEDVIFSFRRIYTKGFSGKNGLGPMNVKGLKALDKLTVLVPFTRPYSSFVSQLAAFWFYMYIAPASFNARKPNGTGPFRFQSFTAGQRSVMTRNADYWKSGLPYADTLTIIDFADSTSLQNALTTGVIQGAGTLEGPQIAALNAASGIRTVVSKSGSIVPFTMRVDVPPFSDVRVRQALRYMVDRPQLIKSALDGYGTPASDVFSPYDPDFDHSLHRAADIGQARHLLKQAGHSDLRVTLTTSAITTGTVAMATVLAQQATQAGIKINIQNVPPGTFFSAKYLTWPFSQDYYNYSPYLPQVSQSMLPGSPFNETHTHNTQYDTWYAEANATFDQGKIQDIVHRMQEFDFTQGGYIIPAYIDTLDAYSTSITGYSAAKVGQPLSNFNFEEFSFA